MDVGFEKREQAIGRIVVEEENRVHRLQAGDQFDPFVFWEKWPRRPLDAPYGRIRIHRYDQVIAQSARMAQGSDVPRVEQVKRPVCENDHSSRPLQHFDTPDQLFEVPDDFLRDRIAKGRR